MLGLKRFKNALCGLLVMGMIGLAMLPALAQEAAPPPAEAAPAAAAPAKIDTGDTAWVLTSSALVLAMTAPGLVLFYGGMVRRKNALGTMMHSWIGWINQPMCPELIVILICCLHIILQE